MIAAVVMLGGAAAAAGPALAQTPQLPSKPMYRWVDSQGRVHYSDRVPPEAVHQQYSEVDGRGRTRKLVAREKTADEAADEARAAKLAEQQATQDRYLLQTYTSLDDLKAARTAQKQALENRRAAASKSLAQDQATLADLRARAPAAAAEGPEAVARLQRQIDSFEASGAQTAQALSQLEIERTTTDERFEQDLARYQSLRSAVPAGR